MNRLISTVLACFLAIGLALMVHSAVFAKKKCETTYENFGKAYMEKYCIKCHNSEKKNVFTRMGAPAGYDFDQVEGIEKEKAKILEYVLEKKKMPPGLNKPSEEENGKLKAWLECEYE